MALWSKKRPERIGLALSGGAVRGAAHVGVLQVLEREGIVPAVVAGTSAGAMVGAAYAAGLPAAEISRIFRATSWSKLARLKLRSRFSLLDTRPMEEVVRTALGVATFEELRRPFAAIATDVLSGERVVFSSGDLGIALRASSAVPGVFAPVEHEGRLLVDGCVLDNLPVDVAREMGADYVIAVDLIPLPAGVRRPRNVLELVTVTGFLWSHANHPDPATVDCVITPAISEYLGWDFRDIPELEAHGRAAAEGVIVQLKHDVGLEP